MHNHRLPVNWPTSVNGGNQVVSLITVNESIALTDIELIKTLVKVKNGNFSVRLPEGQIGVKKAICDTINDIIDLNERMAIEFEKVGSNIGKKGKLSKFENTKFAAESVGIDFDLRYTMGKFTIEPDLYLDYYLPSTTTNRLSGVFSINLGYTF